MNNIWILAEAGDDIETSQGQSIPTGDEPAITTTGTTADGSAGTEGDPPPQTSPLMRYLPFVAIMIIMYLFIFRGPKKKQQQLT